jgi:hypothetical protein
MEKIICAIFIGCIGGALACLGQSFGLYLVSCFYSLGSCFPYWISHYTSSFARRRYR